MKDNALHWCKHAWNWPIFFWKTLGTWYITKLPLFLDKVISSLKFLLVYFVCKKSWIHGRDPYLNDKVTYIYMNYHLLIRWLFVKILRQFRIKVFLLNSIWYVSICKQFFVVCLTHNQPKAVCDMFDPSHILIAQD